MEKLERCGYPIVKIFFRYVCSFWQNTPTWRIDGQTRRHRTTAQATYSQRHAAKIMRSTYHVPSIFAVESSKKQNIRHTESSNRVHMLSKICSATFQDQKANLSTKTDQFLFRFQWQQSHIRHFFSSVSWKR